jgi:GDP-L-fucose synthase
MHIPQRILVTGGGGFLGQHVCDALREKFGANIELVIPRRPEDDLRDPATCERLVAGVDTIVHLAARVGGIGYNMEHPGELFFDNAMMGIQIIEAARKAGTKKFVAIGTICAYPKHTPVPFREDDLWNGYPEETNAPYGLAKKMMLVQAQAYRQQYGMNIIYLLPVNQYGPGDDFDPQSSHVIPALIRKMVEARDAGAPSVEVWGTGSASREFVFVRDTARAIALATERYDDGEPVNIGSGTEISIRELVDVIKRLTNYTGELIWDSSKPDGQPRRCLDVSRAKNGFGFSADTPFEEGLKETIAWFEDQQKKNSV